MNLKTLGRLIPPIRRLHDHRNTLLVQVEALEARAVASEEAAHALMREQLAFIETRLQSLDQEAQRVSRAVSQAAAQAAERANATALIIANTAARSAVEAITDRFESLQSMVTANSARLDEIARQGAEQGFLTRHSKRQVNAILRRTARPGRQIKVLFIVHFAPHWSALEPVWVAMQESEDFDPVVCVVDFHLSSNSVESQDILSTHLERRGVPHLRWGGAQPKGFELSDRLRMAWPGAAEGDSSSGCGPETPEAGWPSLAERRSATPLT